MKLAIGSDKSGFAVKEAVKAYLSGTEHEVDDLGTVDLEAVHPYYQVASEVAPRVAERLRVGHREPHVLGGEKARHRAGRGLAGVAGVGLEREAEERDLPVGEGVEHLAEEAGDDALLLVLVHPDDARPVLRGGVEAEALAEVDEVEDVLLEAAAAEAGPGLEELRADAPVRADDASDLVHVRPRRLAEAGDCVDGRDPLARDPRGVDLHRLGDGGAAGFVLGAADQHAVGLEEVPYRRPLGEELRIGEHGEPVSRVVVEDRLHGGGGANRQGGLLDHDLVAVGPLLDLPRRRLPVLEVARPAGTAPEHLRGGVDADEYDVALLHRRLDVGGEEEVASAHLPHHFDEAWLVYGQREVRRVPGGDPALVDVDDHDPAVGVHLGDYRHRGSADVAGANADYVLVHGVACILPNPAEDVFAAPPIKANRPGLDRSGRQALQVRRERRQQMMHKGPFHLSSFADLAVRLRRMSP